MPSLETIPGKRQVLAIAAAGWLVLLVALAAWEVLLSEPVAAAFRSLFQLPEDRAAAAGYILRGLVLGGLLFTLALVAWHRMARRWSAGRAELERQSARTRIALETARSGVYEWDAKTDSVEFDSPFAELIGMPARQSATTGARWRDVIDPEDAPGYHAAFRRYLKGETATFDHEYRLRNARGETIWVRDCSTALRDADGQVVSVTGSLNDITERVRANMEFRESEADLRQITDNLPGFICLVDRDYRYRFVNAHYQRELGIPREEMVGAVIWDFSPPGHYAIIKPYLERVFAGEAVDLEAEFDWYDGGTRWFRINFVPQIKDGAVIGAFILRHDVTSLKEAQKDAQEQAKHVRKIADNVPAAIAYLDRDYRFLSINETGARWYGRPVEEIVGRTAQEILVPETFALFKDGFEEVLTGKPVHREGRTIYPDGQARHIDSHWEPDIVDGEVQGFFGFVVDKTLQAALEERLRHGQKLEAVGQLTGGVAHDFNNLLLAIQTNLDLIDSTPPDEAGTFLRGARAAVDRAAELTRRLLAFSRRQELRPETVDLQSRLPDFANLLSRTLGSDIDVSVTFRKRKLMVEVDPGQLENALLNLAINARDAMPNGGKLSISVDTVTLREGDSRCAGGRQPGDYVRVRMRDTGVGMEESVRIRVFEPFFTTKDVGQGTGLGLSMVHGFIEQSGGFAEIESKPGRGTTVDLCLPRLAGAADASREARAPDPERGQGTILLVEDDELVRESTAMSLTRLGYDVVQARNGLEARALMEQRDDIDLLFSDVVMPGGLNGLDLAREISRRYPATAILLTSGYSSEVLQNAGRADARFELLPKPYDQTRLAAVVREAIARAGNDNLRAREVVSA